jgi:DNA-binding IclR family transcriptional regulator
MPQPRRTLEDVDRQFVGALARGLEILRCFDAERTELGSVELAALTGLPQPTVWRLCYTLAQCGCLVQTGRNDKFRAGLGVLALGQSALWSRNRRELVVQEMQQLAQSSGCAVSLAIAQQDGMLLVERATPQSMLIVNLRVGSRLPMVSSAMGWAWLAALPENERRARLRLLKPTRVLRRAIDDAVAEYAARGFVTNSAHFHPDVNAIAVPIRLEATGELLAINCGGPASIASLRLLERQVAPRLLALAASIGRALDASAYPQLTTTAPA